MRAITGRGRGWDEVTLSDPMVVRGLISFRMEYDKLHEHQMMGSAGVDAGLCDMDDTIICVYADLDNLIKDTRFTEVQKGVLDLHMAGYTTDEISDYTKTEKRSVENALNIACERIAETNYQSWKLNYIYWNKKKVNGDFKQCSVCDKLLPMTEGYFSPKVDGKDGLQAFCKECNAKRNGM